MTNPGQTSRVVRTGIAFALVFFCFYPSFALASSQDSTAHYYREKSPACIDDALVQFERSGADPSTMIGFLAQLFRSSPGERERILKIATSERVKSVELISLYWAGLPDEAQKFAAANNLSALAERLRSAKFESMDTLRPTSRPADNDLLIGAYMASGNRAFIARILDNYFSADDDMARDAFRIGLTMSKFGQGLAPEGRDSTMIEAVCRKYQCKGDLTKYFRLMTLTTAIWSLQSLSEQDEGIKKTLSDFFARDKRLKALFTVEHAAFGNYLTAVILLSALKKGEATADTNKDYKAMSQVASVYENLGPASEVFAPIQELMNKK